MFYPTVALPLMVRFLLILTVSIQLSGCRGPRAVTTTALLDIEMVRIDGGFFEMGDSFESSNEDALPVHTIKVSTFYLARYETTFKHYDTFAHAVRRPIPVPDDGMRSMRAVIDVSWDEAVAFCEYVGARLPTEREWEYAAAGGAVKQKYAGTNDDSAIDNFASFYENSFGSSLPVGLKMPNLFGLYDMSGNVGEWVADYYEKYPATGDEPVYNDPNEREMRIVRGGGISSDVALTRTYWRAGTLRHIRTPSVGFRCAKDAR